MVVHIVIRVDEYTALQNGEEVDLATAEEGFPVIGIYIDPAEYDITFGSRKEAGYMEKVTTVQISKISP